MKLRLKLATPHGQTNPNVLWLCLVGGNAGDAAATAKYGPDKKLMSLSDDLFSGPMRVQAQPLVVTALRISAGAITPGSANWETVAAHLETIDDAAAHAAALGYNLYDWL
jgi:hypothetical protein